VATIFKHPSELAAAIGKHLGKSEWITVTQEHQWIHVDVERAKKGPFGGPIAHGYLTLSLVSLFLPQIMEVHGISMGVNYGTDKVRFPAPVPAGSKIRGSGELLKVESVGGGGVQATVRVTVEIDGKDKPACVVETISRYYPAS
jgi:acyl dehydratase